MEIGDDEIILEMGQALAGLGGVLSQMELDSIGIKVFPDNKKKVFIIVNYQYSAHVGILQPSPGPSINGDKPAPALYHYIDQVNEDENISQAV
jgi:hypothetical protein